MEQEKIRGKMEEKWAIVMKFAFLFQFFLITSSDLFGLFETMAITLKFFLSVASQLLGGK